MIDRLLLVCLIAGFSPTGHVQEDIDLSSIPSGEYRSERLHSYILFSYDHMGFSSPHVSWQDFDIRVGLDNENASNTTVNVTIFADSINSGTDLFDSRLKSSWFKTDEFPEITFSSSGYEPTGPGTGILSGNLTIKSITKPVTLEINIRQAKTHPHPLWNVPTLGISASGQLNRSDWEMGDFTPLVGDTVTLIIESELLHESGYDAVIQRLEENFGQ